MRLDFTTIQGTRLSQQDARVQNAAQPAAKVPAEILRNIFAWVCFSGRRGPIRPGFPEATAVFSHWRKIALGYRELWQLLYVRARVRPCLGRLVLPLTPTTFHRLEAHLRRAKRSIEVLIECHHGSDIRGLERLLLKLFEHPGVIRSLSIDITLVPLCNVPRALFPLPRNLDGLETLIVNATELGHLGPRADRVIKLLQEGTRFKPIELSVRGEIAAMLPFVDPSRLRHASFEYATVKEFEGISDMLRRAGDIASLELLAHLTLFGMDEWNETLGQGPGLSCSVRRLSLNDSWRHLGNLVDCAQVHHLKVPGASSRVHAHSMPAFLQQFTNLRSVLVSSPPRTSDDDGSFIHESEWLSGKENLVALGIWATDPALSHWMTFVPRKLPALRYLVVLDAIDSDDVAGQEETDPISYDAEVYAYLDDIGALNPRLSVSRHCGSSVALNEQAWSRPTPFFHTPRIRVDWKNGKVMEDLVDAHIRGDTQWLEDRGFLAQSPDTEEGEMRGSM